MAKDESVTVKDAIQKLQLGLLDGIQDEDKLFAAGALMSQSDYQDVVTERSIANMCGYPLCGNLLPSERPRKGRYRISLREHKVYDLQETYMYCSTNCVVNSRAFSGSLQEERSSDIKPAKLNEVLRLFAGMSLEDHKEDLKKDKKSVLSDLRVQEKTDLKGGDVSMEEWIGSANAIEGYVPQRDHTIKPEIKKAQKSELHQLNKEKNVIFSEMDFTSDIIMQDGYNVSKTVDQTEMVCGQKNKEAKKKVKNDHKSTKLGGSAVCRSGHVDKTCQVSDGSHCMNVTVERLDDLSKKLDEKLSISDYPVPCQHTDYKNAMETDTKFSDKKASASNVSVLKSSLKSSTAKKVTRSVTWADEKTDNHGNKNLCDYNGSGNNRDTAAGSGSAVMEADENSYRLASAEACARALTEVAEAVAAVECDVSDAVTDAGLIILPPCEVDGAETHEGDVLDAEQASLKWPSKPGLPNSDIFGPNDSWYDDPPDGFNLTLSPFATMFMALFAWTSSSSLAYIYGHDETLHEEYLSVKGREYPRKVVSTDGRSPEIRQALAGCLARALPGLVADLRLPIPLSTLEREMDRLLDTMSFMDPIPGLKMKQWQLLVLLFLDALSVCRIPTLAPYMTGRRVWLAKVLEGAKISVEEYEIMKDLIIPLGRVPQFVMQSGG